MNVRYSHTILFLIAIVILVAIAPAAAQQQTLLTFPDTPCGFTACDSLVITNPTSSIQRIRVLRFRDGVDYGIDSSIASPDTIPANGRFALHICFSPSRRGVITDSLLVVVLSINGFDSSRVRLTGRGVGAELQVEPSVLNFPKTNPPGSSTMKMKITNTGEESFTLTDQELNIPPPFRLVTLLPLSIPAGLSVEIEVAFEPEENGIYSILVDMISGCDVKVQLGFNGATDLVGTGSVLRVNKVGFNPANKEQISCAVSRCTDVTVSNVGNAPLIIDSIAWAKGSLGYIVNGAPSLPITIAANSDRILKVCLESKNRGVLRDTLIFRSNTRNAIAFGLVLDISTSMESGQLNCGSTKVKRITEARTQAKNFLGKTLLYIPTINLQDQIAINEFGLERDMRHIFPLSKVTDSIRVESIASVDTITASSPGTFTGAALESMLDTLAKSSLRDRVIVLMTDGQRSDSDDIKHPLSALIAKANARGVKVFTIGVGLTQPGAINFLTTLSTGTGAATFQSNDCGSLQQAFEDITDIVSRGTIAREAFSILVTAPSLVSSGPFRFDTTYIHAEVCDTITLTNVGEGDAIVDTVAFADVTGIPTDEFYLPPDVTMPLRISESGQIRVPVCFRPAGLRQRSGVATFSYNNCGVDVRADTLRGTGYAEANLRISDEFVGLPGSTVTMPIYGDSTMIDYGVKTITYAVRWNKSMMHLLDVLPSAAYPSVTIKRDSVSLGDRDAIAFVTIVSPTPIETPAELMRLQFEVLRGDTLATTVEVTAGKFEDGNPKTILTKTTGLVAFDSTCFRSQMGITRHTASKVVAGPVTPTPSDNASATIAVTATAETAAMLEVYSMTGVQVMAPVRHLLHAGANALTIDLENLPGGRYYMLLRTVDGEIVLRDVVVAR